MLDQILITLAIAANTIATLSYVVATVKGEVKPNKISFLFWSLPPIITFFAQITQGVGIQSLMSLSVSILPLLVFIASFTNKKSHWAIRPFDLLCGSLSLVGLVLWMLTKVGNVAILLSIIADGLATLPTIIKAYQRPETEWALPWLGSVAGGLLTLATVHIWNFQTAGFAIYYTIAMFLIFFFASTKLGKSK